MERLLRPNQVAEALNIKVGTLYSWLSRGIPIPHIKVEGTLRFREKAVWDWLLERERTQKKKRFEL